MNLARYTIALAALTLATGPALADCKGRLSQIEKFIGASATDSAGATGATKSTAQAGQSAALPGSTDTQSGPAPGTSASTATTAGTNIQGAVVPGKATGVQGSSDTQSGAQSSTIAGGQTSSSPSAKMIGADTSKTGAGASTDTSSTKMTGSQSTPDMQTARSHLDLAKAALAAGNEGDCMKAADQAAEAAGMPK